MTRRILFFGNCQMDVVRNLYDRFVSGVTGDETRFLPSWTDVDANGRKLLVDADILVEQRQSFDSSRPAVFDTLPIIPVPLVSASFLWPFAGSAHPSNAGAPGLPEGPFPGEFGDGFLNRMIRDGQTPDAALAHYRAFAFDGAHALDRRYELLIEQQKHRDELCDFSIASAIETHLSETFLFLSPHHPGLRITRLLAAECFRRLEVAQDRIELMLDNVRQSPFPRDELPIHPAVAAHFGLTDAAQGTYAWRGEGRLAWDQWVLRYMAYAWSPPLFEGWSIASSKPADARPLLEEALRQLPRSPLAHAGMAKVLQAQKDLQPAAIYAEEAVRLDPENAEYARLGAFIAAADGRRQDAVTYAQRAATLEPGRPENLQLLARYQEETRDFTAAEASRRAVLRLRPHELVFIPIWERY